MGIVINDEYDDLFWNVTLPDGWEIKATNHDMWNELYDDKGRIRATIFYKAAFYDRDAFINFKTRYSIQVTHIGDPKDYEVWVKSDLQGTVKDGETIIFSTECIPSTGDYFKDDKIIKSLGVELAKYMKDHYPEYKDIHAYWN